MKLLIGTVLMGLVASQSHGQSVAKPPELPTAIPGTWLKGDAFPRVFSTPQLLKEIRRTLDQSPWREKYLQGKEAITKRFVEMSDAQLRALIPPPDSLFIMGLGMNLDPVHQKRLKWGGWDHPHVMVDENGVAYPNEQWPDKGPGIVDPKTGQKYYFVAQANGMIALHLEEILPALADVWALSGSKRHAHAAAVLMDAVAAVYPTNRRGPMDYPTSAGDMDRGGRLNNSYYTVARALMDYGFAIDMVADSGELDRASAYASGQSIREHIIRNILWDGGAYCMDFALRDYGLNNGQMDYERGAAVVGALLGVREFAEPMLNGPTSFFKMLANNIGPDGYYVESAAMYSNWTGGLYLTAAELMHSMRRMGWKNVPDPYQNPDLVRFLTHPFDRAEVGGHVPMLGDSGPDAAVVDPLRRYPDPPRVYNDQFLDFQISSAWHLLARDVNRRISAQLLRNTYGNRPITPSGKQWSIYNISQKDIAAVADLKANPKDWETGSVVYGIRGLALLRGGEASNRHGAQLLFGNINGHGHEETLTWTFFARGAEWSYDPGYFNAHYRFGWTEQAVGHQSMTVDMKSPDVGLAMRKIDKGDLGTGGGGTGQLLSWHADPNVQWAMASHPRAYAAEGVTQYERLIAQVQTKVGQLGYWLDIGRVAGGKIRDDSFHSRMTKARFNVELPPPDPKRPALYGDQDLGKLIEGDLRLKGFDDKPFYWWAPGDGYGFLGEPREMAMPAMVRVVMTEPAWKDKYPTVDDPVMVVDLAGGAGRQLIVSHAPKAPDELSIAVPYVICRDTGQGASTFVKVIRLVDNEQADPVSSLKALKVESAKGHRADSAAPSAWCVSWKNGRRDVWIVADAAGDGMVHVTGENIPAIQTDGRVTLVRLDAAGKVVNLISSEASRVLVEKGPNLTGKAVLAGKIEAIDPSASPARFRIKWDAKVPGDLAAGALLRTESAEAQASTWSIASIDEQGVVLNQVKAWLGISRLEPVEGRAGWYHVATPISRFVVPGGDQSKAYSTGRTVYDGATPVGRIVELSRDGREMKLSALKSALPAGPIEATIMLAAPGDEVVIPMELDFGK
jgi:hypothetical protein